MTYVGQCLSCGMGSLESGVDLHGPFARCHLCGWQEDAPAMEPYRASKGAAVGHADEELQVESARIRSAEFPAPAPARRQTATTGTVIAIGGQPGAGAKEIGHRVARSLGCDYYDRLVLERVARRLGATVEAIEAREQRSSTWSERFWRVLERAFERGALSAWAADPYCLPPSADLLPLLDESQKGPKTDAYEIDDREYMGALAVELREIASQGDSVIVHFAACSALPASPSIFRVGVFAPRETRINNMLADRRFGEVEKAHRELAERDFARESFIRKTFRVHPDDSSLFGLTLNTGALSIEDAVEHVLSAIHTRIEHRRGDTLAAAAEGRRAGASPRFGPTMPQGIRVPDETYIKALAGVDIFHALAESQVREIAALGRIVLIPEGSLLASEEAVGEAVYAVLQGQVELSAESEVGRITVRIAHAGEAFPLAAIIGTGKIITRADAMTDLELWRVDRNLFQEFLKSRPEAGLPVYDAAARVMAERYRQTLSRLTRATERALASSRPRVSV